MQYLDENGNPIEMKTDLSRALKELLKLLNDVGKDARMDWFRRTQYPQPIHFEKEIDGTTYLVQAHFDPDAGESLLDKAQRILLKNITLKR